MPARPPPTTLPKQAQTICVVSVSQGPSSSRHALNSYAHINSRA
jgi:hypothetical protein